MKKKDDNYTKELKEKNLAISKKSLPSLLPTPFFMKQTRLCDYHTLSSISLNLAYPLINSKPAIFSKQETNY